MQSFLIVSVIASVVLTVVLNVVVRLFPRATERAGSRLVERVEQRPRSVEDDGRPRVQVWFPWKAMLAISVGLTILVNVVGLLMR